MEKKINFTSEHQAELDVLLLQFLKSGNVIKGTFGANTSNVYELLHNCQTETLVDLNTSLERTISKLNKKADDWTSTNNEIKELKLKQDWYRLIFLLIGYKKFNKQQENLRKEVETKRNAIAKLKLENMTPAERLSQLEAELQILESEVI